jgi:hypothetical protein
MENRGNSMTEGMTGDLCFVYYPDSDLKESLWFWIGQELAKCSFRVSLKLTSREKSHVLTLVKQI